VAAPSHFGGCDCSNSRSRGRVAEPEKRHTPFGVCAFQGRRREWKLLSARRALPAAIWPLGHFTGHKPLARTLHGRPNGGCSCRSGLGGNSRVAGSGRPAGRDRRSISPGQRIFERRANRLGQCPAGDPLASAAHGPPEQPAPTKEPTSLPNEDTDPNYAETPRFPRSICLTRHHEIDL